MPAFTFTSPDGNKYTVNGPDGATPEQAYGILQQHLNSQKDNDVDLTPSQQGELSSGQLEGVGRGLWEGIKRSLAGVQQLDPTISEAVTAKENKRQAAAQQQANAAGPEVGANFPVGAAVGEQLPGLVAGAGAGELVGPTTSLLGAIGRGAAVGGAAGGAGFSP